MIFVRVRIKGLFLVSVGLGLEILVDEFFSVIGEAIALVIWRN